MGVLDYKIANCKNCYKCLRECPVKAISMLNDQAIIIDDMCILCGKCTNVCPQHAKFVVSTINQVKELIKNEKVVVSLAPSYVSSFSVTKFETMKVALKKLGFYDVRETAEGAYIVKEEYSKILDINKYPVFITSSCPVINSLIEKYYPEALPYLAPVVTPMVAHGKLIKSEDESFKVVFIGPCIAKKDEEDSVGVIDNVLTFKELQQMLDEANIDLKKLDSEVSSEGGTINPARYFPIERGIIKSIGVFDSNYDYLTVSGLEKCRDILNHIKDLNGLFIEINACEYGCVNGPCSIENVGGSIKATEMVRKFTKQTGATPIDLSKINVDLNYQYTNQKIELKIPDKVEMRSILNSFGKFKPEDELNCGACGYPTCRSKAIAIYNHMAEREMCLPYMKEKAESLSNQIIKYSPNGIVMIASDNTIIECNERAKQILGIESDNIIRRNIGDIRELQPIAENILCNGLINHKTHINKTNKDVMISTVKVEKEKAYFSIIMDITNDVANRQKILELKQNTIDLTNKVIEKQMRTAQEIASLLGETTAETKVAIYNLRKVMLDGNEEK